MDKSPEPKGNSTASTTAPPLFASFLRERLADPHTGLLSLIAGLTEAGTRTTAAKALAARAGAEDLLVFIRDRELDVLLPAPGFQQTLPNGKAWQQFLQTCTQIPFHKATLQFPDERSTIEATGLSADDGSVLVFLGGNPKQEEAIDICVLSPLIAAALNGERTASFSEGQTALAKQIANQARLLAASLDKARRELRASLADAQRANAAKDRFLAVLSHELRTPLNPVLMAASALESDPNLPPEIRADISMIRRNVELEGKLIDDLLDLTGIANGKVQLQRKIVNAHELLEEAVVVARGHSAIAQARVTLDLAARRYHIDVDPARIQQVFWNLIRNAVKFTPPSGRIRIATRNEPGSKLRVEVIDTGRGIAADALPKIFNAFEQGDVEINPQFGGLGLGLAISKALVDMHDGTIKAESGGLGTGACFTVEFDLAVRPDTSLGDSAGSIPIKRDPRRILLVEDHLATAALMLRLLRKRGHRVELAHTKAAALALRRIMTFDVVISDLGLPDGNGYEVMEAFRDSPRTVGIALSGYGMDADVQRSRQAGFSFHLTKPVDTHRLYETLDGIEPAEK
ncbi:MAG: ATP-binding protein [Spartobacteria bacterium]